jgi:hypothetical protein
VRLNVWEWSWPLQEELCPCDVHLVQYLARRGVRGRAIFHFGTGEHHLLGRANARRRSSNRNDILGVTASAQEHQAYVDLVMRQAAIGLRYKVLFLDIYTLNARLLPRFDLVTLFHLCEFYDPVRSRYAPLDDADLVEMFMGKLERGGRLVLYRGSSHFTQASAVIERFVGEGRLAWCEDWKSLALYRTTGLGRGRTAAGAAATT